MGNLHEGHLSLISYAKKYNDKILASIFVNPLQFDNKDDLENYPITLDRDIDQLKKIGCNYLLIPDINILTDIDKIKASKKANELCGKHRPGHFNGVLTILNKFIDEIRPTRMILGRKDYQQYILVKDFVRKNYNSINVIGCETVRDNNGLALSSRNNHLSSDEKILASELFKVLQKIQMNYKSLSENYIRTMTKDLEKIGFTVDYLVSCDAKTLEKSFDYNTRTILVAVAAYINNVRLIDNILINKLYNF